MTEKFRKSVFFTLLVLTHLLLSYYYFGKWWNSSLGTLLLIGICYAIWRKEFLQYSGLKIKLERTACFITLTCVIALLSLWLMSIIAKEQHVRIEFAGWKNIYHDIFYILNEEIVFGSAILFPLVKKNKVNPLLASFALAFIFSICHFAFYKWIFIDKGVLHYTTLITLFFVAVVRNNLILHTGHIAYSWALHFGWMVIMFGCNHLTADNIGLSEPARFNMYLGSNVMVAISLLLALGTTFVMYKKHRNNLEMKNFML